MLLAVGSALMLSLAATAQVKLVLQPSSSIQVLAGDGSDKPTASGLAARSASLAAPRGIAYDAAGNLYIADSRNHVVTRRDATGTLTIIAGTGRQGYTGDGGPASSAELDSPHAVVIDVHGNVLIADTGNHCIRRIGADGFIRTIVGSGRPGSGGDGGLATAAQLRQPSALAVAASGDVYIADTGNHVIRKLGSDGTLSTIAGSGAEGNDGDDGPALAASLQAPSGLSFLPDGSLLIADRASRRLRVLLPDGTISAYAPAGSAGLRRPEGIAADATGSVYLADSNAQTVLQSGGDGISVVAGSGEQSGPISGSPLATPLDTPAAVSVVDASGDIAISDRRNHLVERLTLPRLDFGSVSAGDTSAPQSIDLQNGGAAALQVLAVQLPPGFELAAVDGSGCGAPPFSLAPSQRCDIAIRFQPLAQGNLSGIAQVRVSSAAPQSVLLSGISLPGTSLADSAIALKSNIDVSYLGTPVSFTAIVTGSSASVPGGNTVFFDGDSSLGTVQLTGGSASLTTSTLQQGLHVVHATYSGDAVYRSSTSASLQQTIAPAPDFLFTSAATSYSASTGGSTSVAMTLQPINGALGHEVNFRVTGTPPGTIATILPSSVTLAGDPQTITLKLQLPAAVAAGKDSFRGADTIVFAGVFMVACSGTGPGGKRRSALLLFLLSIGVLAVTGCGSGVQSKTAGGTGQTASQHYTVVVTATTTSVTGDVLAHSASFGLDVAP